MLRSFFNNNKILQDINIKYLFYKQIIFLALQRYWVKRTYEVKLEIPGGWEGSNHPWGRYGYFGEPHICKKIIDSKTHKNLLKTLWGGLSEGSFKAVSRFFHSEV